ncbi:hypothetical protein [uncultured Shewanella sp.]|uniref:hypothetical protein n=1 Tax=uncultured Shewanella sp. TaxID=173975 RepID=UPI00262D6426|nr:hypothetical protein [uncultured Shewanella sp.]
MSSPIGGFYLNAQYRKKAEKFELSVKPRLSLTLELWLDEMTIIKDTQTCQADMECHFSNPEANISVLPTIGSNGVIRIIFSIIIEHHDKDIAKPKQQVINVDSGESLSTLVEGNERVKLKISCNIC